MKSSLMILSLALVSLSAQATSLPEVQLKYEYLEKGISICSGEKQIPLGERNLICDRTVGGTRISVKTEVNFGQNGSLISSEIEHIDANGRVRTISKPRIAMTNGETSSVSQENDDGESIRLIVTPTFVYKK